MSSDILKSQHPEENLEGSAEARVWSRERLKEQVHALSEDCEPEAHLSLRLEHLFTQSPSEKPWARDSRKDWLLGGEFLTAEFEKTDLQEQ